MSGEQVVELVDEATDCRYKLDKALRNEHHTEVVAILSTLSNSRGDLLNNLIERHVLGLNLLRDDADVRLGLESALKGDVRSRTAHELNEVPILAGRVGVALDVTNELSVNLCSGVETKACLDLVVLQVTINGLRATDNLYAVILSSIVLSQHASVSIRVVTTDNYDSLDIELAKNLDTLLKLTNFLKLRTARTDHIETTCVTIVVNELRSELDVVVVHQTAGTHQETVHLVGRVHLLHGIEDTANHIVTTRSLTT